MTATHPNQNLLPNINKNTDLVDELGDELLFFTDTSPLLNLPTTESSTSPTLSDSSHNNSKWHDLDDDSLISLSSVNRFKKLRQSVDDCDITASNLSTRLASHFISAKGKPYWSLSRYDRIEQRRNRSVLAKQRIFDIDSANKVLRASLSSGIVDDPIVEISDLNDIQPVVSQDECEFQGYDANLMSTTTSILSRSTLHLPKDQLMISRLPNLSYSHTSVVSSIAFHPSLNILLTTGLDQTLRVSQIDGRTNSIIARVHFPDLPIHSLSLHPKGTHAIVSGRRSYSFSYHIETGVVSRIPPFAHVGDSVLSSLEEMFLSPSGDVIAFVGASGNIVLVDEKTHTWICNLKMNGSIRSLAWVSDDIISSIGSDGVIYMWDVPARRCISKWNDYGGFKNSAIAVGQDGQSLATGSHAGIVNIYRSTNDKSSNNSLLSQDSPGFRASVSCMTLIKSVDNITTPIYKLGFNHDAQILGLFSRSKKDQFKLVHLPTCTVFSNWPTQRTPLSHVQCFGFSPHSGILAIGNEKGRILLYNLKHYRSY